ncbi:hypothetical protein [Sinosporangium siamense]|uniref:Uncharacterized protein n=1 Tax=Sinosporangium siamense TaxID=1367973 RepID=A0A919RJ05_9ACTN|nr:hypothetical protein [Sinosporangium siamense]GII93695.1 hypothetical protein Ssi02_39260 [Sinosporangium siamense]
MMMENSSQSKFSVVGLIVDHYGTFRNYQSGKLSPVDYMVYLGIPAAMSVGAWVMRLKAGNVQELLAAVAILTGLIFGVFVLIFDLSMRAAGATDSLQRIRVSRLVEELRANVSYAVLLGVLLTATLSGIIMFGVEAGRPVNRELTALVIFLGSQLLLTILMILKRVRATFRSFYVQYEEKIP